MIVVILQSKLHIKIIYVYKSIIRKSSSKSKLTNVESKMNGTVLVHQRIASCVAGLKMKVMYNNNNNVLNNMLVLNIKVLSSAWEIQ